MKNQNLATALDEMLPECSFIYQTNQTQMPTGDDDDLVGEELTDREAFPEGYQFPTEQPIPKAAKFMALYDDAKSRELR